MTIDRRLFATSLAAAALLAGCASSVPLDVHLGASDSGRQVTLYRGQQLVIELQRGSQPGYGWRLTRRAQEVFDDPLTRSLRIEGTGPIYDRFTFTAVRTGQTLLRIDELRTDGVAALPLRSFEVKVTVQ